MPAHIFVLNEENYKICIRKGLVGLPEAKENSTHEDSTNDAILSRMAAVHDGDYVLFYITKDPKNKNNPGKELRGVWKAVGEPFYDDTPVWEDKKYPFRCRIDVTKFSFKNPLKLNDIYDLRNAGKVWTFALNRASGTNVMFSISNVEFEILLQEYLKINPFDIEKNVILEPHPVKSANLMQQVHVNDESNPCFEASLMALLAESFVKKDFQDIFGNYSDYLSYVPTNLGTEMDILLSFSNPYSQTQIISYDIIEVKLDRFKKESLQQLIGYESWFIRNRVHGDMQMVRASAIARRFDSDVIEYVRNRSWYEGKEIKLFTYSVSGNGKLSLNPVELY